MKKFLASVAFIAAGALTSTAVLADGPGGRSLKDAPLPPSCGTSTYNWSGAFAGLQLGTANFRSVTAIEDILGIATSREESGFTIGGIIGYNWQKCNTVFGIEADLAWTDIDRSWGLNLGGLGVPPPGANLFNARSSMDLYGSVKMRTGFAFDNLLLYLTGGFAFANIEHRGADTITGNAVTFNSSDTRFGWVVGAGTEYALTDRITWRSEATYTRFEDKDFNLNLNFGGPPLALKLNAQDELWMVRTGINFKF